MNSLQKLALNHIKDIAKELDNEAIKLGNTIGLDKEKFDAQKHTYPIAGKARTIERWIDAIIECDK